MLRGYARASGFAAIAFILMVGSASALPNDPLEEPAQWVQEQVHALPIPDASIDCETEEMDTQSTRDCREEAKHEARDERDATADNARQNPVASTAVDEVYTVVDDTDAQLDAVLLRLDLALYDVEKTADEVTRTVDDLLADDEPYDDAVSYRQAAVKTQGPGLEPLYWFAGATVASAAILWVLGSSGIIGSTGSAGAAGEGLRRVAPAGMFTRFQRSTVLDHPRREQMYRLIGETPGIRLQDLCDATGLSRTAVTHHLRLLEQQHLIVSRRVGRSRHFYENGGMYERSQKEAYALLQNDRSREIAAFIQAHPGAIQKRLCEELDVRASIIHWHVQRLRDAGLIRCDRQGRTVAYYPDSALASLNL